MFFLIISKTRVEGGGWRVEGEGRGAFGCWGQRALFDPILASLVLHADLKNRDDEHW